MLSKQEGGWWSGRGSPWSSDPSLLLSHVSTCGFNSEWEHWKYGCQVSYVGAQGHTLKLTQGVLQVSPLDLHNFLPLSVLILKHS